MVDVSPIVLDVVVEHMNRASYAIDTEKVVFPSVCGKPVHASDWYRDVFKALARDIGRPEIGTHALRHTFASRALSVDMNIKVLQQTFVTRTRV